MFTFVAFLVALALLIAVHEYGHYRMAVACQVKVLRFSIGFGRSIWRWRSAVSGTEFVVAAIPLGGYVRMLDEREGPVSPHEVHQAFNRQPLRNRALIVAAGPLANFILAVGLYAVVNWMGLSAPAPILSSPPAGSLAERAGIQGWERVTAAGPSGENLTPIASFDDLRWTISRAAIAGQDLELTVEAPGTPMSRVVVLALSGLESRDPDAALLRKIGIVGPATLPVIVEVMPQGAAQRAGLQAGDRVLQIGADPVRDGAELRSLIRSSWQTAPGGSLTWKIQRGDRLLELAVAVEPQTEASVTVGKVGAYVGGSPEWVTVRYGAFEGLWQGIARTWEVAGLTLGMMGKILVGEASLSNLSGPLTIADYAGKSASLGFAQYLLFLALISVSLGVLNLLPIPALDGGHLMYYLWESLTGRSLTEVWLDRLQRGGFVVLAIMMSIAIFNDLARFFG